MPERFTETLRAACKSSRISPSSPVPQPLVASCEIGVPVRSGLAAGGEWIRTIGPAAKKDGRDRFRGRLKQMIKTGGVNVAPLEVGQFLLQDPEIVQPHVVGIPEIVTAAVELQGGAATDPAAILGFCRERRASYKIPARLAFRTAAQPPHTPTGKIHKPSLVEELAGNSTT